MMPKVKRQEAPKAAKKATRAVPAFSTLAEPASSQGPTEQSGNYWAPGIDYASVSAPKPLSSSEASSFEDRVAILEMLDD